MSADEHLNPEQFSSLQFDDYPYQTTVKGMADAVYRRAPKYMAKLEKSVRRRGVSQPIMLEGNKVMDGHHRIAAAYRTGQGVPTVPYNDKSVEAAFTPGYKAWAKIRRATGETLRP